MEPTPPLARGSTATLRTAYQKASGLTSHFRMEKLGSAAGGNYADKAEAEPTSVNWGTHLRSHEQKLRTQP